MSQALIIGGSGMLAQTSVWLAEQGYKVAVIGRSRSKLQKLQDRNKGIIPVSVDYTDGAALQHEVRDLQHQAPITLVVAWIHRTAPHALAQVLETISQHQKETFQLFHVLGSSSNLEEILKKLDTPAQCQYVQVQLGFKLTGSTSRWLTNEEISMGVIDAIQTKNSPYVVGQLHPWEKRP
ncbi:KR domain-containing protein [Caldalkalibacillus salinus]|uniref:KR domain-containing protein n=1 Tax=Caldalkalibacillus salinus TaxID=2803787 RepID=UPI001921B162|nr:short-chain dehydrogenase [Caldalkalibacillus salinus]